ERKYRAHLSGLFPIELPIAESRSNTGKLRTIRLNEMHNINRVLKSSPSLLIFDAALLTNVLHAKLIDALVNLVRKLTRKGINLLSVRLPKIILPKARVVAPND